MHTADPLDWVASAVLIAIQSQHVMWSFLLLSCRDRQSKQMLPCTVHTWLWAGDSYSAEDDIRPHHQLPGYPEHHVLCRQGRAGSTAELRKLEDDEWREGNYVMSFAALIG